jgi:GNAT superfamily N-acetyltransferase
MAMLRYRTFRNTDPPAITAIWRSHAGGAGPWQPVSVDLFEQLVFGKLYFDYQGMILAWDDDRPVGFAHAGFGPNAQRTWVAAESGITCMIMVRPDGPAEATAAGLLERSEAYLRQRGAKMLYGGGLRPLNPFYLGLYGGAEPSGVLDGDSMLQALFRGAGYEESERRLILRRELSDFRPLVDRQQVKFRRSLSLQTTIDAPACDWWEATTAGDFDLTRFRLCARGSETALGCLTVRTMDATGQTGPMRGAGILELHVEPEHRRQGLATFLVGEAISELHREGYGVVEAHVGAENTAGLGLYRKLGLQQVDQGLVFRKPA